MSQALQSSDTSRKSPEQNKSRPKTLSKMLSDNSLSIALFSLFVIFIVCQSLCGWRAYDESLQQAKLSQIGFGSYLTTGDFLNGVFSNWQAAILQLAVLIGFSSVLRQRGAAHSRKPDDEKSATDRKKDGERQQKERHAPTKLSTNLQIDPTNKNWLYNNSLSLAMFSLFILLFVAHWLTGVMKYNEDQALRGLQPLTAGSYFVSWDFWFSVFQTWEAEFFAIGLYIVLSIFLRQERSSESKPTDCSNDETGETND